MRQLAVAVTAGIALLGGSRLDSAQLVVIRGRVVLEGDAATPVRGAKVMLSGGAAKGDPVFTDGDGRFALGVPAPYALQVSKAGRAPTMVAGTGASPSELEIRLSPGAAITGRVADQLGFGVPGAFVSVRWVNAPAHLRSLPAEHSTDTDDAGHFRIGSLVPGRYALRTEWRPPTLDLSTLALLPSAAVIERENAMRAAQPVKPLSAEVIVEVSGGTEVFVPIAHQERAVLPPDAPIGGAITGAVFDQFGDPMNGLALRLWRLRHAEGRQVAEPTSHVRRTDDRGQYRFFYVPPARYVLVATGDAPQLAPVFHPGVTTLANASPIVVMRKQEVPGISMTFVRTRHSRVSGVVRSGGTRFGDVNVSLVPVGAITQVPFRTLTDAEGYFEFSGVVPGEYVAQAFRMQSPDVGLQRLRVTEGGDDVSLTLAMAETASLHGRVVTDDGRPLPPGLRLTGVLLPEYATPRTVFTGIAADGTFEMRGLSGPVRFTLTSLMGAYRVRTFAIGPVNAAEEPVVFEGARDSRNDVLVTVVADAAAVEGRVTDAAGGDVDDYRVILFSVDRRQWFVSSPSLLMTAGPNADGRYTLPGVVPGDYWVIAMDVVEGNALSGEWQTPEFLDRIAPQARRITVGARERVALDLRLVVR